MTGSGFHDIMQASLLSVAETPAQIWAGNGQFGTPQSGPASAAAQSTCQPEVILSTGAAGRSSMALSAGQGFKAHSLNS